MADLVPLTRAEIAALKEGDRVRYAGWRGDSGEATFVCHLDLSHKPCEPDWWPRHRLAAVRLQRDFSVGTRDFLPFVNDGEAIFAPR